MKMETSEEAEPGSPPSAQISEDGSSSEALSNVEPTFERVLESWPRILDEVRRRKISIGSLLAEGVPAQLSDGTLDITFGKEGAFHVRSIMRSRHVVEGVLAEVFQGALRIQCVTREDRPNPSAASARLSDRRVGASEEMYRREPVLQTVVDLFQGEIVLG